MAPAPAVPKTRSPLGAACPLAWARVLGPVPCRLLAPESAFGRLGWRRVARRGESSTAGLTIRSLFFWFKLAPTMHTGDIVPVEYAFTNHGMTQCILC